MIWRVGDRVLSCGGRTLIMGIVNVTPDSFYDGGRYSETDAAVDHALSLVAEGADMIDVGGESSRPPLYGAIRAVPAEEEWARVVPVVRSLARQSSVPISVDTTKAEVAARALDAGAVVVNDISALSADARMVSVVAGNRAGVVLMHMRGTPRTMQRDTAYTDLLGEVEQFLHDRVRAAREAGVEAERIVVDPGIGFGKSAAGNEELLARLGRFARLGRPLLVGVSRKSFVWKPQGQGPEDALEGSLAAAVISVLNGAHILRVHDVGPTLRAVRMTERIRRHGCTPAPDTRNAA